MLDKAREHIRELLDSVLNGPGNLGPKRRREVSAVAEDPSKATAIEPLELGRYLDKVSRHAYRVTPEDFRALREAGLSDDLIFEVTVVSAVAASRLRLDRGLAALRGDR
jgi:alkylhydroperoxidase family enzyme